MAFDPSRHPRGTDPRNIGRFSHAHHSDPEATLTPTGGEWQAHTHEQRPWQQQYRQGSREDRTLTEITVALPPPIAELHYTPPTLTTQLLAEAEREIHALDTDPRGHLRALSGLLIRTESVASSKIEHVDAGLDDYARATVGIRSNPSATSMVAATHALTSMIDRALPTITREDILAAHQTLMADDPHEQRYAGVFRPMQNWIGGSDYSPRGAVHIPPPPETVERYMADLIAYVNRDDIHPIVQAAIAHAQFESIHPFTDGNGRIGRALIGAVLRRRRLTEATVIPIASAMLADRGRYFALVNNYRDGKVTAFVDYLAVAARTAAAAGRVSATRLAELPTEWEELTAPRRGSAAAKILTHLTTHPILTADIAVRLTGSPTSSVYTALERLETDGVLHQVTSRKRDKVWAATAVLVELDELETRIENGMRAAD